MREGWKCANQPHPPYARATVWADRSVSWSLKYSTQALSSIHGFRHKDDFLANYAQCGKFHTTVGGRLVTCWDYAWEWCVLYAHLEPQETWTKGDTSLPVFSLVYDTEPPGNLTFIPVMGRTTWSCGALILLAIISSCGSVTLESIHWSSSNTKWVHGPLLTISDDGGNFLLLLLFLLIHSVVDRFNSGSMSPKFDVLQEQLLWFDE